jgi:hypothetical protein
MDHEDPAIRYQCLESLRTITEKDFGIDPAVWRRELEPLLAGKETQAKSIEKKAAAEEKKDKSQTILGPN